MKENICAARIRKSCTRRPMRSSEGSRKRPENVFYEERRKKNVEHYRKSFIIRVQLLRRKKQQESKTADSPRKGLSAFEPLILA